MDQESTLNPQPTPGRHSQKFRRRPPASAVEQARRKAWGKQWGKLHSDFWKLQRTKGG